MRSCGRSATIRSGVNKRKLLYFMRRGLLMNRSTLRRQPPASCEVGDCSAVRSSRSAASLAGCGGSSDTTSASSSGSSLGRERRYAAQPGRLLDAEEGLRRATSAFAQTSAGKGVAFAQSFGASGSQSRAVDSGQPADVVAFSTDARHDPPGQGRDRRRATGTPTPRRGSPATRSSCSSCARATPSTSPAGMT